MGGDAAIGDHWRAGLVAGYSHTSFDLDARASSGNSDNYHLGVFGGGQWGAFGLRAGGAYTRHKLETARTVDFSGFSDALAADYDAGTAQVFGEAGYRFDTDALHFEPFVGLAYVSVRNDGFTEKAMPRHSPPAQPRQMRRSPPLVCAPRPISRWAMSRHRHAA